MSADSVVTIGWDVLKCCVVVPIKRGFVYVISSKRFANDLREEAQNLQNKAERVHEAAEVARNNLWNLYRELAEWEASAEKALKEAQDLLGDFEKATKTCCYGILPNPKCRYQFSRNAEGKIEVIERLTQKCSEFRELNDICCSAPAPGNVAALNLARRESKEAIQSTTTATTSVFTASTSLKLRDDGVLESRALMMRKIIDALADDSNSVVGIYGMGGVGKSTLLADIESRIREEKSFDWIATAAVSENPDIEKIQGEIADALGLTDIKKKEYGSGRAELLRRRLKEEESENKKVLIILDNLWKGLDLKSVGIPCGHYNKVIGCKLLLTSRDRHVLRREMRCDKAFLLDVLVEKEAKRLFETTVGGKVHVEFEPLADEALRKSAGLPFLIRAMAELFIDANLSELNDALNQIELSADGGISAVINKVLRLSYDRLESEEAKNLLKLCAAYGVSKPSVENLVRFGYGWGLFQKDSSMKEARDKVNTVICTLQASSLLLDNGDVDGFKIHDLVRDFVAQFILRDHPLLLLKDEATLATQLRKERLKSCMAICFPNIDMKELPEELDCPELLIFLHFSYNKSLEVPDSYFNSMRKLAVLNLTSIRLTCSSAPFQSSENLHTLCLQNCSLEDVAILGKLKGLQILSFMGSKIQQLPKEIGQLVELRLLDLSYCSQLNIIEPGVLRSLIKLEELYMESSFDQWNSVEQTPATNASLLELNHMKNLYTLHVSIPKPSALPRNLNVEKLTKYKIQIGHLDKFKFNLWCLFNLWRLSSKCRVSRTLELKLNPTSNILQKGYIRTTLDGVDDLWINELNGIEESICQLSPEGFPQLKRLHVENGPSIHYILRRSSLTAFKMLEVLFLRNLISLEKLCHKDISFNPFCKLKVIRVNSCDKMEVLFPGSVVRELPQLEEIDVCGCKSMCGIVEADDCGKFELPNLRVLQLRGLPNMKNFFTARSAPLSSTSNDHVGTQIAFFNGQQVAFPRLETLFINGMDSIEIIWDNQVAANSFPKLNELNASHCDGLSSMISPKTAGNLVALTKLRVSNCRMLTEVISDEGSEEGHVVAFSNLKCMELHGLRRLRCFSSSKYALTFPLLEDFIVSGCPNMKFFSEGRIEASKLKRVKVSTTAWFWKENLNITIRNMFEERSVKFMQLSEFPKLIGEWHSELNPIKSSWQLESLVVDKCPSFVNAIPLKLMLVLENLRTLQVCNCKSLEEIFDVEGLETMESTRSISSFTTLNLVNLPKLIRLWNKDLQGTLRFSSLRSLILYKCSNLRHAFTLSMAGCLANLSSMEIMECGQMEGVIVEEEGQGSAVEKITLSKLEELKLECLPNLTAFLSRKNHSMECLNLKRLTIDRCPRMKSLIRQSLIEIDHSAPSLFTPQVQCPKLKSMVLSHMDNLSKIWTKGPQETLTCDNLWEMEVQNCRSLKNLFPHWVAISLTQLEKLRVESCEIEEIVTGGDDTPHSNTAQDLFPKLTSFVLHDMPRLKSFGPNMPTLNWPLVKELRVTHCDKLNMLSFGASVNSWAQRDDQQDLSDHEAHSSFERDFPNFERLLLVENNIPMIQEGNFPGDIFSKPKALTLACFHDEKAIFPSRFLLERFQDLQSLEVFCSSFEDIFPDEGLVDERKHSMLENLRELKLNKLHNLKLVWREDSLVSKILQSIKTFEVWDCLCLTTIFPVVISFQNLMKLVVKNCSGLVHLVTASAVINLVHLNDMTIIGCERMKEVVADDGNGKGKVISFGNLKRLTLQDLPSLECFSSILSCSFRFPLLGEIEVEECPKMKTFTKSALSTPKLYLASLFRYKLIMYWEEADGDLNTTIQKLSA